MKSRFFITVLTCQLTACSTMIDRPSFELVSRYQTKHALDTIPTNKGWWEVFADSSLDTLMSQAWNNNYNVVQASLRREQAQLQAALVERDQWPTLNGSVSANMSRPLVSALAERSVQVNGINVSFPIESAAVRSYAAGIQVSYEADLWRRISNAHTVALGVQAVAEADLEFARLDVSASVAASYWKLAALDQQIALRHAASVKITELARIATVRFAAGKTPAEDVIAQQEAQRQAESELDTLLVSRINERRVLTLLLGVSIEGSALAEAQLPARPLPALPQATTATLLDRRPDLRAKRLRVDSALQQLKIADAARYPNLSFTASLGSNSSSVREILSNPYGSLGLALVAPFLDWQRLRNRRDQKKVELELAVSDFRDGLFGALGEVEAMLEKQAHNLDYVNRSEKSLRDARRREALTRSRLNLGVASKADLLAESIRVTYLEIAVIQSRMTELNDWILLRKAVGGF